MRLEKLEGKFMKNESISISSRTLRTLSELKEPSESVSDFISKLLEQHEKQSLLAEQFRRLQQLIKLHLPWNTVSDYLNNPASLMARENRQLAVMFTDIRSFTSLSRGRGPEDLFQDLNRYLQIMADVIYRRDGIIDKYIGDSIMAYFGYPLYSDNTALQAVLAALEIIDATSNGKSSAAGLSVYPTAIGMSFGLVTIGNIGHPERKLNFTIVGDTVNLASRMESLTSVYRQEILITESIYDKIKDVLPYRLVDTLTVEDKERSIRVFTTKKDLSQQEQAAWNKHNKGMDHFYENDFEIALKCFKDVLEYQESDHLAKMMIERCTKNMQR